MKKIVKIVSWMVVGLMLSAAVLPARAEANAEQANPAQSSEANEFTSVVTGIVEGFEALTKAADAEPAGQAVAKTGEETTEAKPAKHRSIKNSAILIAGGAGLGASVGKMTGKKNAAVIGAIAGGVAGLIYDRATYKNPKGI